MSPVTRRILINGPLAGAVLAAVGLMMANLAGTWAEAQPGLRTTPEAEGLPATSFATDIGERLQWRLPLSMALWGVVLVAVGESLFAVFRKPGAAPAPAPLTPDQQAEAIMQQILAEQDTAAARR